MVEGNTAWALTSTALVLFMTLPGLALFYGGLVYSKNLISVLIQCFAVACLMPVAWIFMGYSIAFSETGRYFGDFSKVFLNNITTESEFAGLPETVFFGFQMTFAVITPASGFVGPVGAIIIGLLAALICYYMVGFVKNTLKIDDTLDVFAVHGIGGLLGTILLAPLGAMAFGGLGLLAVSILEQLSTQIIGIGAVILWSGLFSTLILFILKKTIGIRVTFEEEEAGLDLSSHSESAYN